MTWTFVLPRKRGTSGTGLVARDARDARDAAVVLAGVALGNMDMPFTHIFVSWRHHLSHIILVTHPSFTHIFVTRRLSHTTLSHTIFHTHLCYTTSFTHIFVTHHLCHTPSSTHTHNFVTRNIVTHTISFTHNCVTPYLSHTILSHTILHIQPFNSSILPHLLCLSFLPRLAGTFCFCFLEEIDLWGYPVL